MSLFAAAALIALFFTAYGVVTVWFIASRNPAGRLDQAIRAIAASGQKRPVTEPLDERTIDLKERQSLSVLQEAQKLLGVDSYEANYYPVHGIFVVIGGFLLAFAIGSFLHVIFGLPIILLGLALPVGGVLMSRFLFDHLHSRRRNKLFMQMPDALDQIVRSIRVGVATSEALRTVGRDAPEPTATEFRKLTNALAIGIPLAEAMRTMAMNNKIAEYRFLAIAVALQSSAGGSIGRTLENVADVIRSRVGIKVRGRALTGEARASATVLTSLPVLTTMFMSVVSPHYLMQLFLTKSGLHYFGAAVIMILAGQFTMKNMVRRTLDQVR